MSRMTKTLLVLSVGCLATGFLVVSNVINVHGMAAFYVLLPAGAIFFGLFLISLMLEKETAQYDKEQRALLVTAQQSESNPRREQPVQTSSKHKTESLVSANAR
jgi:phosphate/sulfate permease